MNDIAVQNESRVSAQVPVNTRVSAAAKQCRAILKDVALPEITKIISSPDTQDTLKVKAIQSLLDYSVHLESMVEDHLTKRITIELQAFGSNVKAREVSLIEEEDLSQKFLVILLSFNKLVWFNGKAFDFQSNNMGSTPIISSTYR